MKIALLVVLGLILGALGGAALGIGAGLAWVEIFKTTNFEGAMDIAVVGGLSGALLFGGLAVRDAAISIEREPVRRENSPN
jgi:Na+/glutamate symporter